jgi:SulP family sulfate permease
MAFTIMAKVGEENPQAVIATTITSYAISSVLTGVVFFLMGTFNFGYIVGFIPRHILIGCIGGVGWFLVATGFEVTARLEGNLNYDGETLRKMFESDTIALWVIPFFLAVFLYWSQYKIPSKYYLPMYILAIPAVFYFFVFSLDELEPQNLREAGWIFDGPEAGEPWWYFYTLYGKIIIHCLMVCANVSRLPDCALERDSRHDSGHVCTHILWCPTRAYQCPSSCFQQRRR